MAGWARITRGVIGTAVTFAAGVGIVGTIVGGIAVLAGKASLDDLRMVGKLSVVAFLLGIAFSGILTIVARSSRLAKLSLPRVASMGAVAGLVYFLAIGVSGAFSHWSLATGVGNLLLLALVGSGAATATLLVARRGRAALESPTDPHLLRERDGSFSVSVTKTRLLSSEDNL